MSDIDPDIEHALAPDKLDWKEPLWAKFRNYAIGFGAALILVACIIGAIAYFMPPLAPQTELPKTAVVAPVQNQFVEPNKKVVKPTVKKAETKPTVNEMETVAKPKEPETEFDKRLNEFEKRIPQ